ncbi:50S ribosomal protein L4 [Ferrimicrobium acidiphilum]|jgi:large subunit ribosomal protein L4|uniref:Large ribosomal subunit protein uL4 n=1 Tax=Ferrimicrobium acidiphilum DSM 19497 TaxID=1121877 RepID=A0A0D8FWT1_9ACTN|nr:50S ribosomal protein L4 [Ferrimicrobium acidiphilum]KJE77708.1 50S ribosomal protein L4 [Ferrimicrobium acidiphilum DSM 19497]MCL5973883.1 50S ribosomal protein L4 [Actinomycetota bacterium]
MTQQAKVVGVTGSLEGEIVLVDQVFDVPANVGLLHQVVVAEEANRRRGTHSTKTRAEVSGGGAKPFRQKGTGNARQGSTRAPQFTGGGIVHGPRPRSYAQATPKKMVRAALRQALSDRARGGAIYVLRGELETPSTKGAVNIVQAAGLVGKNVSLVALPAEAGIVRSFRNLPELMIATPASLLTRTVLTSDVVLFTEAGLSAIVDRLSDRESE